MKLWRDGLFWSLFIGGLLSYLMAIFGYTVAIPVGSLLLLGAFAYLTVNFLQRNFGKSFS
jgi:hypothetical protein